MFAYYKDRGADDRARKACFGHRSPRDHGSHDEHRRKDSEFTLLHCTQSEYQAEAESLVSFAKFPVPKVLRDKDASIVSGIRGVGSPFAPAVFGQNLNDYIATANRNTFVCVQIESVEGLANCEAIAAVPGIGASSLPLRKAMINLLGYQTCYSSDRTTCARLWASSPATTRM